MAGHAAGASSSRWYKPMPGFHPHQPAFKHRWGAKLLGATMWFWIFYRAKQDGAVLLVSLMRLALRAKARIDAGRTYARGFRSGMEEHWFGTGVVEGGSKRVCGSSDREHAASRSCLGGIL